MADPKRGVHEDVPVIEPGHSFRSITEKLTTMVLTPRTPLAWFATTGVAFTLLMGLIVAISYLLLKGIGIWGNNIPVGWAFDIINFVWWIGIGHAGTLISAILLLFRQQWRTSINRFAEAMTLFAVACAGMFPLLHTGRPWLAAYWLFPYPNTMQLWPQFRSPLIWDVFAVTTYFTVSLLFWFTGLIPDLATLRDSAKSKFAQRIFGVLALGWRGSAQHWQRYETIYLLLAGLSTPLVLSVHTVVSFDFAVSEIPGWHATFLPPYFVAGAIYSGFAMVMTLAIPMRAAFGLDDLITMRHIHNMTKIMLATGMIVLGRRVVTVLLLVIGVWAAVGFAIQSANVTLLGILLATVVAAFGVQDLLRDYVSGYYVLLEHHIRPGDRISMEGAGAGTVMEVRLRVTLLQTGSGDLLVVPNSELFGKAVTVHARAVERAAEASEVSAAKSEPQA